MGGSPTPEFPRRKILTGGMGSGPAGGGASPPGTTPDPLKGIPQDYVNSWVRLGLDLNDPKAVQRHADRYWGSRHRAGMARPA